MEEIKQLQITNFIGHVVNHQTGSLELSDSETPLDEASRFPHDFFQSYILYALHNDLRRRASFRSPAGVVKTAFDDLLAARQSFVESSRVIADHLYKVMSASRYKAQIKAGDIMVALFKESGEGGADSPAYMAILKIDPSDAIIREVVQVNGGRQVRFQRRDDRIPEVEENKIQKIAVLSPRPQVEPEPHDLVILDNNIKRVGVAHFFFDEFLQTKLSRNPKELTEALLDGVKLFVSTKPSLLPEERLSIVNRAASLLQQGKPISLDAFTLAVAEPEAVRAALLEELQSVQDERLGPAEIIMPDADEALRQSKTLIFILDGGVRITGPVAQVRDLVKISPPTAGVHTITIKTQTLEIR
jgi:hypothetical protein